MSGGGMQMEPGATTWCVVLNPYPEINILFLRQGSLVAAVYMKSVELVRNQVTPDATVVFCPTQQWW